MDKLLWLLLLVSIAAQVQAQQTTYNYIGAPLGGSVTADADSSTAASISIIPGFRIGGTVVLAQPLAPNGTQVVTPVSANFGGVLLTSPSPAGFNASTFTFSFTTVNGVITAWDVEVAFEPGAGEFGTLSLTNTGDNYFFFSGPSDSNDCRYISGCVSWTASNQIGGVWTAPGSETATLQTELDEAVAEVASLKAQVSTLTTERNSYLHGYLAENATIAAQNAALVQLKLSVYHLNQQVAKCRADMGKC